MLIKTLLGIALFAAMGAAIGYSQVLCTNGQCAMTGTPYGGALLGGFLGFALMSSLAGSHSTKPADPSESDKEPR